MSKIFKIFLIFISFLSSNFITDTEYAKMLYENPRGISCAKCHGEFGEGLVIAKYKQIDKNTGKKITLDFKTPKINDLELLYFAKKIRNPSGVMPSYFLSNDEIITLYNYLIKGKK